MMRQLAAQGSEGLKPDECQEVVDFIADSRRPGNSALRLLEPSFRKVIYARHCRGRLAGTRRLANFHEIGKTAVPKVSDSRTYDLECLRQVVEDYPDNVADRKPPSGH